MEEPSPRKDSSTQVFAEVTAWQQGVMLVKASQQKRTEPGFWTAIAALEGKGWTDRAKAAAAYAKAGDIVADIGCGGMVLEPHLPEGCTYLPMDVAPRDPRTILIDLNAKPPLPDFRADVAFCLGVFEYLIDPEMVIRALRRCAPRLVFSYRYEKAKDLAQPAPAIAPESQAAGSAQDLKTLPNGDEMMKLSFSARRLTSAEMETVLQNAGWRVIEQIELNATERIIVVDGDLTSAE